MRRDIKHTSDGDVDITGNDINYVESTQQHQSDLLLLVKGELKDAPSVGVGLADFIGDEDNSDLSTEIRTEFRKDGMKVSEINIQGGIIKVNAAYDNN